MQFFKQYFPILNHHASVSQCAVISGVLVELSVSFTNSLSSPEMLCQCKQKFLLCSATTFVILLQHRELHSDDMYSLALLLPLKHVLCFAVCCDFYH